MTRELRTDLGAELTIQLYSPKRASLSQQLPQVAGLEIINPEVDDFTQVPLLASRRLLEQAQDYDLVGYLEDDLLIEDPQLFGKILYLDSLTDGSYAFLPHR